MRPARPRHSVDVNDVQFAIHGPPEQPRTTPSGQEPAAAPGIRPGEAMTAPRSSSARHNPVIGRVGMEHQRGRTTHGSSCDWHPILSTNAAAAFETEWIRPGGKGLLHPRGCRQVIRIRKRWPGGAKRRRTLGLFRLRRCQDASPPPARTRRPGWLGTRSRIRETRDHFALPAAGLSESGRSAPDRAQG
jgi:hypothetical protein